MLGYMTAKEALANGFTNHGKYYGIPVWIRDDPPAGLMVATKWAPMEAVMTLFHCIEGFLRATFMPDEEPAFCFYVGKRIEAPRD